MHGSKPVVRVLRGLGQARSSICIIGGLTLALCLEIRDTRRDWAGCVGTKGGSGLHGEGWGRLLLWFQGVRDSLDMLLRAAGETDTRGRNVKRRQRGVESGAALTKPPAATGFELGQTLKPSLDLA